MELDAEETYQKVEYLENQLIESKNEVEVLTVKLKKVEKNYMDLKKTIATDQQIILNRLDSLQSDNSQQKQYVSNIHTNMDKNFANVRTSILRVSTRNNDTIKEAMAAAVKIAMMGDSFDVQEDSHDNHDNSETGSQTTTSFGSRKGRKGSMLYQSFSLEPSVSMSAPIDELNIETIESRPVMKDALFPELNLSKDVTEIEEPDDFDNDAIRFVNNGSDVSENPYSMSIMDILKSKGVHLSKNFPNGPTMYESADNNNNNGNLLVESLNVPENIKLLTETNKRLNNYEAILSALTFRVDHSTDIVDKLHSAVRLLDSEHNGLLASHKELMRKTDRSEAVTMSILDQIIHACETCQAAVERQEGLSLEQARQFRIISDRIKKKGGDDNKSGTNRITFTNAGYAAPSLPTLPNIKEWESMENSLTDQKIDPNTIMKQLDEYRRVYRSMVLEMNQIMHKNKDDNRSSSPPKHVNVMIPQAKSNITVTNSQSNTTDDNTDIKNILQRSDLSYNPTIMYLKDEIGNMKKSLSKIQNVKIKPVPKHTLVADVEGNGPNTNSNSNNSNNKKRIINPRPPSESKTSRGSMDFNLDEETVDQLLTADIDNGQQFINHHHDHNNSHNNHYDHHPPVISINQKPSRINKYFEKYTKKSDGRQENNNNNNNNNDNNDDNDYDNEQDIPNTNSNNTKIKNNKNQFIKGDWPNNNNNDQ